MSPIKIQIAGIKNFDEAQMLLNSGVDMIGFPLVLPVHKPDVSEDEAADIIRRLGVPKKCLLITYLQCHKDILELSNKIGVNNIQLHGDVVVEEINKIRKAQHNIFIIKSIVVAPHCDRFDLLDALSRYEEYVDAFIIDTFDPLTGASGATGKTQDWNISKWLVEHSVRPVILAGGLNPKNVYEAIKIVRPYSIDVHTGIEDSLGNKDARLVADFVREAKRGFQNLEKSGLL